ncbi:lantibiotic dehydratase [Arcicella aquatica]|uniref:Lantibiotic dehydratase n=1 Tax=Arcicella aquatica TaxID=217141 RepID=A0ABU5QP61_9BACT|nr:lantibiotic dehydratase [Arcicella aquatica]MEA5258866.1 lantibiotic dehydratase [Arcicella aquatica]
MSNTYQFLKKLIVRTPSLPFIDDVSEAFLKDLFNLPTFSEALYLASPVLYHEALLWKDDNISDPKKAQKIAYSISKYYSRMSSRCTPFGLFAGCTVVEWDEETNLQLASEKQRSTRLDMHYAGALAQSLSEIPLIKKHLKYYPNSSIYQIGNEIRYIEYKYIEGRRTHQITAFEWSEYIALVLDTCKRGAKIQEIVPYLIDDDISEEEATDFIEQLVDAQLLVNELEPAITGEGLTQQMLKVLQNINAEEHYSPILLNIEAKLKNIDAHQSNDITAYQEIITLIKQMDVPFEDGKLFQTDLVKVFNQKKLSFTYQEQLSEVAEVLFQLGQKPVNSLQEEFIQKFYDRYEGQEVPILVALDTETGIGYGQTGKSNYTPIANGFEMPSIEKDEIALRQNAFKQYLFKQYLAANKQGAYEIALNVKELEHFQQKNHKVPSSTSLIFRLTGYEQYPIYLEKLGGATAMSLLGRFAHTDAEIFNITKEIAQKEQALNPEVIFAEIIHLPENRIGNILLHPVFWPYEIPYLAKSSLPEQNQILLEDLMVSVNYSQKKIKLISKRLNKEVIPRLSNAHSYSLNALPIYYFLCDLQAQNIPVSFNISLKNVVPNAKFLPRITFKNIIVESATWKFDKEDYQELINCSTDNLLASIKDFSQKWGIPNRFVLADFDNELLVNTDNLLSVQTWLDTIKNRKDIELKEFLFNPASDIVINQDGETFTNQFIASLINKKTVFEGIPPIKKANNEPTRKFSLGSEWLYVKIYSGVKAADDILTQAIKPLVAQFLEEKVIDKWFFIRYLDPDNHIRVRFHFTDLQYLGKVIIALNEALANLETEGIIRKIQFDTYQRELERYGADAIALAESIFFYDSEAIVKLLEQTWGDEREQIRWQFSIKIIDAYLDDFEFSLHQKLGLMTHLKDSFAKEFSVDKHLKLQMDNRFRENRKTIEGILAKEIEEEYVVLFESIQHKSERIKASVGEIKKLKNETEVAQFLSDTIHMTVNRSIADNQRFHELIIYDFMYRYYQAEKAKSKKS